MQMPLFTREREGLKGRLIARHGCKLLLPDPADHLLAALNPNGRHRARRRVRCTFRWAHRIRCRNVARPDKQNVSGFERHVLRRGDGEEVG